MRLVLKCGCSGGHSGGHCMIMVTRNYWLLEYYFGFLNPFVFIYICFLLLIFVYPFSSFFLIIFFYRF